MDRVGRVKIDVNKSERQYELVSLSDIDAVKGLIMFRSKFDKGFGLGGQYPISASGAVSVNQELIALYSDLDVLIDGCSFTDIEKVVVSFLQYGYDFNDLADSLKCDVRVVMRAFHAACKKIVAKNQEQWLVWANLNYIRTEWKICSKCGESLPLTDQFFYRNDTTKDGFRTDCKKCFNSSPNQQKQEKM